MAYTPIDPEKVNQLLYESGSIAAASTVIMNNQGTMATSANQLVQTALQTTGNALATVIAANSGTTMANQVALATTLNVYGPGGTRAHNSLDVDITLDPNAPSTDSSGRLRVSSPGYRFDGVFTYQVSSDLWDQATTGGTQTWDATNRMVTLTNNAGTNVTVLQSHYHAPTTPGRSQLAFMTFNLKAAPTAGVTKRAGYFDGNNGIFLEWDAANGVSINIVNGGAGGNQRVPQANWSVDKMDGTGRSALVLDLTKVQNFYVSLQALFTDKVTVGFAIDGIAWPVHQFVHANHVVSPYLQQANQPIRFELRGTNAASSTMDAICASVISEGGADLIDIPGRTFVATSLSSGSTVTARIPLLTIRPKSSFNGVRNDVLILPQTTSVILNTNNTLYFELVRNGTVTGPFNTPYVDVDTQNSAAEYNTNGTAITGGQVVYADYVSSVGRTSSATLNNILSRLVLSYSYVLPVNPADTFSVAVTSVIGVNATVAGVLMWKEIR